MARVMSPDTPAAEYRARKLAARIAMKYPNPEFLQELANAALRVMHCQTSGIAQAALQVYADVLNELTARTHN